MKDLTRSEDNYVIGTTADVPLPDGRVVHCYLDGYTERDTRRFIDTTFAMSWGDGDELTAAECNMVIHWTHPLDGPQVSTICEYVREHFAAPNAPSAESETT